MPNGNGISAAHPPLCRTQHLYYYYLRNEEERFFMSASNSRDKTTLEIGGFGRPMAIVIISAVSAHMITYNLLYNDLSVRHITHIMDGLCHSFYFFLRFMCHL